MRQPWLSRLALAALTVILWGTWASAQAADPLVGTWKLNAEKSKYSPGPPQKGGTVRFEAAGEGIKVTADFQDADGATSHTEYTGNYDGKDYPLTGSASADTVSLKRIDANTTERTDKKDGKVVATFTRKVSNDGKTLTVTHKGTNAKGEPVNNLLVLEKQ